MAATLIDINDVEIRIHRNGSVIASPGVAHLDDASMVFGEPARAKLRYKPQGGFDKYWAQLDDIPLSKRYRGVRHHADLAYHHLHFLLTEHGPFEEVIFLVPSDYNHAKLAMLLGIAKALSLDVKGIVDSAVATVAALEFGPRDVQFLDQSLHRTVVSRLEIAEKIRFSSLQTLERSGKNHLSDIVMNWIADCFLDQARFDPLQDAASEQLMFDQLDEWLTQLREAAHINIGLELHGRLHEISLAREELIRTLSPAFAALATPLSDSSQVVLSHHFAIYPQELLSTLNGIVAAEHAAFNTVTDNLPDLLAPSDEVALIRSMRALPVVDRVKNGT